MAKVSKLTVRDNVGSSNLGKPGELVTLTMSFDEALTITNNTLNGLHFRPTFMAGGSTLNDVSFVAYNAAGRSATFTANLPNASATAISLTNISLSDISITGKTPFTAPTTPVTAVYTLDNVAPTISTSTLASVTENAVTTRTAIVTATARDNITNSKITYRLSGDDAEQFSINTRGVVTFKTLPDADVKSNYNFKIVATDSAGNSSESANLSLTVAGVNERVTLAPDVKGAGVITVVKGAPLSGKTVNADFVDPERSVNLTATGLSAAGVTFNNGTLTGTPTSAGSYRFTVNSNDNVANGTDASRAYTLVVLDKPAVEAISISDTTGPANTGVVGGTVNIQVTLTEALSAYTASNIGATFSAGSRALTGVSQTAISGVAGKAVISFTGTLPAGDSNSIVLTSLNLGSNTLTDVDSDGDLTGRVSGLRVSGNYLLDNSAPRITSAARVTINENIEAGSAVYKAVATDASDVSYSLTGNDAGLFTINNTSGVVSIKAPLNYEDSNNPDRRYTLTVTATDVQNKISTKVVNLSVKDVNEATMLKAGLAGTTGSARFTKNSKLVTANVASDFIDPEGKAVTYRITDGWLTPGLKLNAKTGVISGMPEATATLGNYNFTVTADDGVANGTDASRSYQYTLINTPIVTVSDTLLAQSENTVLFTAYYAMLKGGTVQIVKVGVGGAADTAIGSAMTLTKNTGVQTISLNKSDLGISDNASASFKFQYKASATATPILSDSINITTDISLPRINSVQLSSSGIQNTNYLNVGDVVTADVTFNESVAITGSPTLKLLVGPNNSIPKLATFVSASDNVAKFVYTVVSEDNTGAVGIKIDQAPLAGATVRDLAGNTGSIVGVTASAETTSSVKIDNIAPVGPQSPSMTASGGNAVSGTTYYNNGDVVTTTVTFSESVTASAGATLNINVGNTVRAATILASDVTNSGTVKHFTYQIAGTDNGSTSFSVATNTSIAGTFTDLAGNSASGFTLSGSHSLSSLLVDTVAPTITGNASVTVTANTYSALPNDINFNDNNSSTLYLRFERQNGKWRSSIGNTNYSSDSTSDGTPISGSLADLNSLMDNFEFFASPTSLPSTLRLTLTDSAGNQTGFNYNFTVM